MYSIGLGHYLTLAAIIFIIGIVGIFLNRKNVIVILMSIELILLAVNINLVSFSECRIEIGFNENLNKDFIKDLSNKLFVWTGKRWIISLSKKKGAISKKQEAAINKNKIFDEAKKGEIYKKVLEIFPDAELADIRLNENKDD